MSVDLFKDIILSIQQTKKVVVTAENERDYVPFVVNRSISFHLDMVMAANQMNLYPATDGLLQYQYLLHNVRAYKRPFQKWQKRETIDNLELIKTFYGYSNDKAKDALALMTDDQIKNIKSAMDKGGVKRK